VRSARCTRQWLRGSSNTCNVRLDDFPQLLYYRAPSCTHAQLSMPTQKKKKKKKCILALVR
jgi:hypothetical protein